MEKEREQESNIKIEIIKQNEKYERHKKVQEERNRLELLKQETDLIKYNPNEFKIGVFKRKLQKINEE
jgi:hypothetical protein